MSYTVVVVTGAQAHALAHTLPTLEMGWSYQPCLGFHYFSPELTFGHQERSEYLLAYHDTQLVGALKLTRSLSRNGWTFVWVDVQRQHRQQGIFTLLLQHLNDRAPAGTHILGTLPSDEGYAIDIEAKIAQRLPRLTYISTQNAEPTAEASPPTLFFSK